MDSKCLKSVQTKVHIKFKKMKVTSQSYNHLSNVKKEHSHMPLKSVLGSFKVTENGTIR